MDVVNTVLQMLFSLLAGYLFYVLACVRHRHVERKIEILLEQVEELDASRCDSRRQARKDRLRVTRLIRVITAMWRRINALQDQMGATEATASRDAESPQLD